MMYDTPKHTDEKYVYKCNDIRCVIIIIHLQIMDK